MVYLNHAATTYPKPIEVTEAVARSLTGPPVSQYRSVAGGEETGDVVKECKERLALLFGIERPADIYFTSGATQSLNMAIQGLISARRRIVITAAEHNGVLRTIVDGMQEELAAGEYELTIVPCDRSGYVDMEQMETAITEETALVVVNHSSNVTGAVQDVARIGAWASHMGACFLVDASQSAGAIPIDVEAMHIDILAFTAHKGLYGIEGLGGIYIRDGVPIKPLLYGGTGLDSRTMIPALPYYEVGTANMPGIAALHAGVGFILSTGMENIRDKERMLMECLYKGLKTCPGVTVYADRQPEGTALSFNIEGLTPSDTGYILSGTYKIIVRTGLHCAPWLHTYMGTQDKGTVRVSVSYMTQPEEVAYFLASIRELAQSVIR